MTLKKLALATCLVVGLCLLLIAGYLFAAELSFLHRATALEATIVEVRTDSRGKGKGSVPAYFPMVEIPGSVGVSKVAVETFSEQPVYRVGDKIAVLWDPASLRCKKNTFVEKWGGFTLNFILSLVFFFFPLLHYWRLNRSSEATDGGQP